MALRLLTFGPPTVRDGDLTIAGAAAQPRRLALLALLARAGDRGLTRDKVVGVLWPDEPDDKARRNLTHALYALRRDLGSDSTISGSNDLRLDPDHLSTDVADFTRARERGDLARAAALYVGPFLDGFHLPASGEFERWADRERRHLSEECARVLEELATKAEASGDTAGAVAWWRRLAAHDPLEARIAVRLMRAHAAAGDVGAALRHARIYETLVEQELELPPDKEVVALADELRRTGIRTAATQPSALPQPAVIAAPAAPTVPDSIPTPLRNRHWWLSLAALALIATTALLARRAAPVPILAVGILIDHRADTSDNIASALRDMLATDLARTQGLRVVSTARLYELIPPGDLTDPGAVPRAAHDAGATELVDGSLFQRPDGTLRLDLRRVRVADGEVRQALTVEGSDPFQLVDAGTNRLLAGLGRDAPPTSIADVTTRSLAAYRLYEQGLRAYATGDASLAEPLFAAAVAEDTAFAMAAYYFALTSNLDDPTGRVARFTHAMQLADRASERERLMIRAAYASATTDPILGTLADSLRRLYPDELTGYLYAGQALVTAGEFVAALAPLDSAIRRDSLRPSQGDRGACVPCQALSTRTVTWILLDSLRAAEGEARRWVRLAPGSPEAYAILSEVLDRRGQMDEAFAALERSAALDPTQWSGPVAQARFLIRAGRNSEAIRAMTVFAATGPVRYRNEGLWTRVLAEREVGDLPRALADARRYRREGDERAPPGAAPASAALEAIVLLESGRPHAAAFLFDSIGRALWPGSAPSSDARTLAWGLVRSADAWAVAGDTARLGILADSVERVGARSGLGRDRRLHHHIRGLLWMARGRPAEAEREFRAAIYSVSEGYTRTNLMLARVLLAQGKKSEAARFLRAALDGALDGSALYVTRRVLQQELARAQSTGT